MTNKKGKDGVAADNRIISVKWVPSESVGWRHIHPSEVDCETVEEFLELPEEEQRSRLNDALCNTPYLFEPQAEEWEPVNPRY